MSSAPVVIPRFVITRWFWKNSDASQYWRYSEPPVAKPDDLVVQRLCAYEQVEVLEAALATMSRALDGLAGACLDAEGKPRAPDHGALMRALAMLPPACKNALKPGREKRA